MPLTALTGRVALITGASRGLGKAMALALAEAGARVALVARDVAQLNAVADHARQFGVQAEIFRADISDEAQVLQLERDVVAKFGAVDILGVTRWNRQPTCGQYESGVRLRRTL